jgi:flagellar basal body-associated protein FliL
MLIKKLIGIIILTLLCVIVANAQSQGPPPSNMKEIKPPQKQSSTQQQKPEPDKRGTEQRPFVVNTIPTPKSQAETEQDRKEHQERATQGWWAILLTAIVAFATFLQALFLFFTLRETKKAANAATKGAKVAEDALHIAERAYLSIDQIGFVKPLKIGEVPELKLKIFNTGKTPAQIVDISTNVKVLDEIPPVPVYSAGRKSQSKQMPIRAGGEHTLANIRGDIITAEQHANVFKGKKIFFLWGRIIYQDIFKNLMVVGFGVEYAPDGFLPVDEYNYIAEYEQENEQS